MEVQRCRTLFRTLTDGRRWSVHRWGWWCSCMYLLLKQDSCAIYSGQPTIFRGQRSPWSAWGRGGGLSRALLSREPLVIESRASRHSTALHKTHPQHLNELRLRSHVRSRSDHRSKSGVLTFWALGTRILDYHNSNSGKMF